MKELGDDTAMNMDGGGSSEMVALSANGVLGVRNVPSDGHERLVANGLGITFRP
jgi:exopolysaccharide biosynthesis protein